MSNMNKTKIEYLRSPDGRSGYTWNPLTGCTPCSPGCANCWAKREAEGRLRGRFGYDAADPFKVTYHPNRLDEPLKLRKPARIAVCFMGDLLHDDVGFHHILQVFDVIENCPQHTFLVLTKRARRLSLFDEELYDEGLSWPSNLHLGVSVCTQKEANEKTEYLLATSATVKFLSLEPLLEPISIKDAIAYHTRFADCPHYYLDWVVVGCEKLRGGRPGRRMNPDWARMARDECAEAGTPFYMKQMEIDGKVTSDMAKFPEDLRIRQMPEVKHGAK